jgi:hypothetical protein
MSKTSEIKAVGTRFQQDCTYMQLEWDEDGKYVGQWQTNMMDEGGGDIFLTYSPLYSNYDAPDDLTPEQMQEALKASEAR